MTKRNGWCNWASLILLAGAASVLLAAPVFPSQDGPVHLYYVDVLRGVLKHSAPYAQHFEMKSLVTPYELEYCALLAIETLFSPAVSEKLLICFYVLAFGLGFRYLVESVAERASPWILAGIPFCMHLLVYLGFLNYCFAVALLLFLCGFWIRHANALGLGRIAVLVGGLALILLTHPVPAAIFLLFIGLYFVADLAADGLATLRSRLKPLALIAAMGAMAIAWVALFVNRSNPQPSEPSYAAIMGIWNAIGTEFQLFATSPLPSLSYRAGPILLLALAVLSLFQGSWKDGARWRSAPLALLATSAICFAAYCLVPRRINGSWYFAERFPILFLLFLLAAASAIRTPHRWSLLVAGAAICVTFGLAVLQWRLVARLGAEIAPALASPVAPAGSKGLIVSQAHGVPEDLAFDPYFWAGAHYFRRSQAIMTNAPWMDLPILMMRPKQLDRWSYRDPAAASRLLIEGVNQGAGGGTSDLDFLLENRDSDPLFAGLLARQGWLVEPGGNDWLRIYRRSAGKPTR